MVGLLTVVSLTSTPGPILTCSPTHSSLTHLSPPVLSIGLLHPMSSTSIPPTFLVIKVASPILMMVHVCVWVHLVTHNSIMIGEYYHCHLETLCVGGRYSNTTLTSQFLIWCFVIYNLLFSFFFCIFYLGITHCKYYGFCVEIQCILTDSSNIYPSKTCLHLFGATERLTGESRLNCWTDWCFF